MEAELANLSSTRQVILAEKMSTQGTDGSVSSASQATTPWRSGSTTCTTSGSEGSLPCGQQVLPPWRQPSTLTPTSDEGRTFPGLSSQRVVSTAPLLPTAGTEGSVQGAQQAEPSWRTLTASPQLSAVSGERTASTGLSCAPDVRTVAPLLSAVGTLGQVPHADVAETHQAGTHMGPQQQTSALHHQSEAPMAKSAGSSAPSMEDHRIPAPWQTAGSHM